MPDFLASASLPVRASATDGKIPLFLMRAVLLGLCLLCPVVSLAADHKHGPTGTYAEWTWPSPDAGGDGGFRSFEHTLMIDRAPGAEVGYFWAHQVEITNGATAYLGLQTLGRRPDGSEGKVAIFSIWNALAASGPGIAQPFGGEGEGYQTMIPYDWETKQKYRLRIFRSGQDRRGTQWTSTVRDESTGEEREIGTITVPKKWGLLGNWSVMWSERYTGPEVRTCDDVGYSKVWFSEPTANNGTVRPESHHNYLTNPANCPNSKVSDARGGAVQEMGIPR